MSIQPFVMSWRPDHCAKRLVFITQEFTNLVARKLLTPDAYEYRRSE